MMQYPSIQKSYPARLFSLVVFSALACGSLGGQVVVTSYDFTGGSVTPVEDTDFVDAGNWILDGSGANVDFNVGDDGGFTDVAFQSPNRTPASPEAEPTWYFSFSVTTQAEVDFDSIRLNYAYSNANDNNGFYVRSSVDSFANDLFVFGGSGTTNQSANDPEAFPPVIVDLSGSDFQNVAASTTITFRISAIDTSSSSGRRHAFDNVQLYAVPEPALSALAFGLSGVLLAIARRRGRS